MSSNTVLKSYKDQKTEVSWDNRLHQAMDRYAEVKGMQPALIPALIEGLTEWSEHLPYSYQDDKGVHLPVNKWGLGAEYTEIYALVDWLIVKGRHDLTDSLRRKFESLYKTTKVLDDNFPKVTPQDERTENRLIRICRRQTDQVTSFLEELFKVAFKYAGKKPRKTRSALPPEKPAMSHRKRSQCASDIEILEKALIEHIKSARDYAWAAIDAKKGPMLLPRPLKNYSYPLCWLVEFSAT